MKFPTFPTECIFIANFEAYSGPWCPRCHQFGVDFSRWPRLWQPVLCCASRVITLKSWTRLLLYLPKTERGAAEPTL